MKVSFFIKKAYSLLSFELLAREHALVFASVHASNGQNVYNQP